MRSRPRNCAISAALIALVAAAAPARAGRNDLVLARLGDVVKGTGGNPNSVVGNPADFRSMMSELGVVLAPRISSPSDTLGFGGFQFSTDMAFTTINSNRSYWRVLESQPTPDSVMPTLGFTVRKGIGFPLPLEIDLGTVHLLQSKLWAGQAAVKFALNEGYHDLPLPSLAVRGAVSRVLGEEQIDLTVASVDVDVSEQFGINGTVNLTPYAGWNWLITVARSDVIDKTPNIDPLKTPSDRFMNFSFKNQSNIYRNEIFGGLKLKYAVFAVNAEAAVALAGSSVNDVAGTNMRCQDAKKPTENCDAADHSGTQQTYTVTVAMDF